MNNGNIILIPKKSVGISNLRQKELECDLLRNEIVEYDTLASLHQDLTKELLLLDVRKPKIEDYEGYNFRREEWLAYRKNTVIGNQLQQLSKIMYIIGYVNGDDETKQHEYYHYLYYAHKEYRDAVRAILGKNVAIQRKIYALGYQRLRLLDEAQAIILTTGQPL